MDQPFSYDTHDPVSRSPIPLDQQIGRLRYEAQLAKRQTPVMLILVLIAGIVIGGSFVSGLAGL